MEFVLVPKGKSWLGGGNGKVMETRRIQADVVNYVERFTICRAAIDAAGGLWQLVEWPENARSTREP